MKKFTSGLLAVLMVMVLCMGLIPHVSAATDSWTVIGTVNGKNWETDFEMIPSGEENVLISADIFDMAVGNEFKIRKNNSWDEAYPGSNYTVTVTGKYRISFNTTTHDIRLIWAGEGEEPTMEKWTVRGSLEDSNWNKDFIMAESDTENVLITTKYFLLGTNDAFKILLNDSYMYPENNYEVTETGVFYITFNTETKEIGLKPLPTQQWEVCGSFTQWESDPNYALAPNDEENVLITHKHFTLNAGDTFKIRLNGIWDISYGTNNAFNSNNIRVTTAGDYYISFNLTTHEIKLVPYVEATEPSTTPSTPATEPQEPTEPSTAPSTPATEPQEPTEPSTAPSAPATEPQEPTEPDATTPSDVKPAVPKSNNTMKWVAAGAVAALVAAGIVVYFVTKKKK